MSVDGPSRADRLWNLYWFGPERLLLRLERYWHHYWMLVAFYFLISFSIGISGQMLLSVLVPLCALILPLMLHIDEEQQQSIREADEFYEQLQEFKKRVDQQRQSLANLGVSAQQAAQSLHQMASLVQQQNGGSKSGSRCACDSCHRVNNAYSVHNNGGPV